MSGKIRLCTRSIFNITIEQIVQVARFNYSIELDEKVLETVKLSRCYLENKIASGSVIYGLNTGFGGLSNTSIGIKDLEQLQKNIVRSHAVGVGRHLDIEIVRAMIFLLICSFLRGFSGVRIELINILIKLLNFSITPCVPEQGSLGASGDLAPLAHIALCIIGEGSVKFNGFTTSTSMVFNQLDIKPIELKAKEGLALINGTHLMSAIGALAVYDAKNLLKHADIVAALSGDVMDSTDSHLYQVLHSVRPHKGQQSCASNIRRVLCGSELLKNHQNCSKVQDAYSIRCTPQVHGASFDVLNYVLNVINIEINSVTDNPLIFRFEDTVVSGGNFHGQPLALAADFLCISLAEIANISERRTARLTDKNLSTILPPFLVRDSGVNSGLMIAQYTAAALVSENKVLSHPASVDSITSSANQEDHVSMGANAMRKCRVVLNNVVSVIAIELFCATQALDLRRPIKTSTPLEAVHKAIREKVAFIDHDRFLAPDVEEIISLIKGNFIVNLVEGIIGVIEV